MLAFALLSLFTASETPSLIHRLHEDLAAGKSNYSTQEIALIASGVENVAALKDTLAQLQNFLQEFAPSEKQKGQAEGKQQRVILKSLGKALKKQALFATLLDGIREGEYNPVTASFFFDQTLQQAGLGKEAWPEDAAPAASFFGATPSQSTSQILSSLWLQHGQRLVEQHPQAAATCLQISLQLQSAAPFEADNLAREWYNHSYRLYERKALLEGARLITASARRFPALQEYKALCYNYGILLAQNQDLDFALRQSLIEGLIPLTGEHSVALTEAYGALKFNQAIAFYEAGEYAKAWNLASALEPTQDAHALKNLKGSILENLIEDTATKGQPVDTWLDQLAKLDSDRHQRTTTRLKQIAVKTNYDQGNLEEALKLASAQIGAENGRDNYLAVLQKIILQLQASHRYEDALSRLANTPTTHADPEPIADLRYNTYLAWLDYENDAATQFPIYHRALADSSLNLNAKERGTLMENMGNAYYLKIEALIADRSFSEAQALSKEALRHHPDHANLRKQGELIKTIMERIKN